MTSDETIVPRLYGVRPETVIDAIKERRARQLVGDDAPDGKRLGLVIEGGAIRGVSSAGGAVVLAQLGYSNVFDEVHATSAAVMNAAYFMTNQPLLGISVYFDNCTTRSFVNPWRFWKIVDVDYIFDRLAVDEKRLDLQKLLKARGTLYVAAIDKDTGKPAVLDVKAADSMLKALKASAAIPILYNRAVKVGGHRYIDGGLAIPFGLVPALRNGCTHVLVLSTRPATYQSQPPTFFQRLLFNVMCAHGNAAMNRLFAEQHLRSREIRAVATGQASVFDDRHIATVCTEGVENVSRMERNVDLLRAAATSYGRRVLAIFGRDPAGWDLPLKCAGADKS
jgi:predicted patatin/cPLA2 family phospholipase